MENNMENEMEPGVIIAIGILNNTHIGPKVRIDYLHWAIWMLRGTNHQEVLSSQDSPESLNPKFRDFWISADPKVKNQQQKPPVLSMLLVIVCSTS